MIVCICHRVSDREIARHVGEGMDFDDIQFELGVATQCGQCEGCARDVVAQCKAEGRIGAASCAVGQTIHFVHRTQETRTWNSYPSSAAA